VSNFKCYNCYRPSEFYKEEKVIVSMSSLVSLIKSCSECGGATNYAISKKEGAFIQFAIQCTVCLHERTWNSSQMLGQHHAINNLLSAAILFTGNSATKCLRLMSAMNLAVPQYDTFIRHQRKYLHGVSISFHICVGF
jgi:hypothetical protein